MLVYIIGWLKITIYGYDTCICMREYPAERLYNRVHYHMTKQPHWPYMDILCCIHDTCMRVWSAEWLYNRVHYHMSTQQNWPYMDILCCLHDTCMRVWPAEWLYSCVHTLSHAYATIFGSCICITHGAEVRHLRTIPIYVRGPVIINRHFDNKKSRDQHWPITARFMCTKYTFLRPVRLPLYYICLLFIWLFRPNNCFFNPKNRFLDLKKFLDVKTGF